MKRIYGVSLSLALALTLSGLSSSVALAEEVKLTAGGIPTTWTPVWGTSTRNAAWLYGFYAGDIAEEGVAFMAETGGELAAWCGDGLWQEDFDAIIEECSAIEDTDEQIRCAWRLVHETINRYENKYDQELTVAFEKFGPDAAKAFHKMYVEPDYYVCRDYAKSLVAILGALGHSAGFEAGFDGLGGHAWAEAYPDDGRTLILDSYNLIAIEVDAE